MARAKKLDITVTARPVGRPTDYQPEMCDRVYGFTLLGLIDKEIAAQLGIGLSTMYEWKAKYPEFADAFKRGKEPADVEIAQALWNNALGAEYTEQVAVKVKRVDYDEKSGKKVCEREEVVVVNVKKKAPPNTAAQIFWLKNRQKDQWRDRIEHTGKDGETLNNTTTILAITDLDAEQRAALADTIGPLLELQATKVEEHDAETEE